MLPSWAERSTDCVCRSDQIMCTHTWVSACVRAIYVLEWKSKRSSVLQLSAGFRPSYSLFAWLTLDALIAPRWLFLVFWKSRPHSQGKALGAHVGESCRQTCCRTQRATAPLKPHFVPHNDRSYPSAKSGGWGVGLGRENRGGLKYRGWKVSDVLMCFQSECNFLFTEEMKILWKYKCVFVDLFVWNDLSKACRNLARD